MSVFCYDFIWGINRQLQTCRDYRSPLRDDQSRVRRCPHRGDVDRCRCLGTNIQNDPGRRSIPGGSADILARLLGEHISKAEGLTVIIENRPGGGASIAYEAVARAAPDGNTLVINANSFVINPYLRKVNYDPLTGYEPICYLLNSPQVIVVNSNSPYRTPRTCRERS